MESDQINKILYIGTGKHIQPIRDFPNTKEFIFVDTQSRSEFDDLSYYSGFYRGDFYDDLVHKCLCFGFKLNSEEILDSNYYKSIFTIKQRLYYSVYSILPNHINPTLLSFYNEKTEQYIKYYISTNIQYNMCSKLQKDIEESNALVISGYHPNIKLLKYFTHPKIFIGYSDTYYDIDIDKDKEKNDSIISLLNQSYQSEYFNKYLVVSTKTGKIKNCCDFFDIKFKLKELF